MEAASFGADGHAVIIGEENNLRGVEIDKVRIAKFGAVDRNAIFGKKCRKSSKDDLSIHIVVGGTKWEYFSEVLTDGEDGDMGLVFVNGNGSTQSIDIRHLAVRFFDDFA